MQTTREAFSLALMNAIERAPDKEQRELFKAFNEYSEIRRHVRQRIPIVTMMFDAIEEGLSSLYIEREMEQEEANLLRLAQVGRAVK